MSISTRTCEPRAGAEKDHQLVLSGLQVSRATWVWGTNEKPERLKQGRPGPRVMRLSERLAGATLCEVCQSEKGTWISAGTSDLLYIMERSSCKGWIIRLRGNAESQGEGCCRLQWLRAEMLQADTNAPSCSRDHLLLWAPLFQWHGPCPPEPYGSKISGPLHFALSQTLCTPCHHKRSDGP